MSARVLTVRELRDDLAKLGLDLDDAYALDTHFGWMKEGGFVIHSYGTNGKVRGTRKMKALRKATLATPASPSVRPGEEEA